MVTSTSNAVLLRSDILRTNNTLVVLHMSFSRCDSQTTQEGAASLAKATTVRTVVGNTPKQQVRAHDDDDEDSEHAGDESNPWMQDSTTTSSKTKKRMSTDSRKRSREVEPDSSELDMSKVAKLAQSADVNGSKNKKQSQVKGATVTAGMQSQQQILARAFTNAVAEEDFEDEQVR
jgi:hypothetical protein